MARRLVRDHVGCVINSVFLSHMMGVVVSQVEGAGSGVLIWARVRPEGLSVVWPSVTPGAQPICPWSG